MNSYLYARSFVQVQTEIDLRPVDSHRMLLTMSIGRSKPPLNLINLPYRSPEVQNHLNSQSLSISKLTQWDRA